MSETNKMLRKVFNEAVEIADAQRRADYLASACGADTALRQRIEELIAADAESGRFLGGVGDTIAKAVRNIADASGLSEKSDDPASRSFGDYELLEEIARGGMGIVYKARQVSLDRIVAVKMLLFGPHASSDLIRRFKAEAVAAGSLHHPNIVAIHEIGIHDGQHFMVMDYVDGPNLAKVVRNVPLSPKRAARYVQTIAEAIHYAHERGILHRDLKPSNVLIDSKDEPRVTDFGLARRIDSESGLTETGQILGSPNFMPPEQAAAHRGKVSRRSDVYGLGAILYHLLTGRVPFEGQTLTHTLQQVLNTEPVPPRSIEPSIPLDLETICAKCMEKDPTKRYATAQEVAEELGRHLRDEPVRARPVGRSEKTWRWCRRNPVPTAFVATLCVALGSSLWLLDRVNKEKNKQEALAKELKQSNRENIEILARSLSMTEENLEGIWANKTKRVMVISSEVIAGMAQLPIVPITNRNTLLRSTFGFNVTSAPGARLRLHAKLMSELETRMSESLGREVRLDAKLYKTVAEATADMCAGKTDFSRMSALPFLRARRQTPGLQGLVVPVTPKKIGVFFTTAGTGIRSLAGIRGRSVAFGEPDSTVSYWAQIKLAQHGISATNLSSYDFLDSTLEFEEDVQEFGLTNVVQQIGYLNSHAQVIEGVLAERYDVGVAMRKAFQLHQRRGLVEIPGTEFDSSRTLYVARPGSDQKIIQAFVAAMTGLQGRWLEMLPEKSSGFEPVVASTFAVEEEWLDKIAELFPPKGTPKRLPVPAVEDAK